MPLDKNNGALLALGAVGAVAVAGALAGQMGSRGVVRLGDKKEVVLVLQTRGGKYKLEVVEDPKYPKRPYQYRSYTSGRSMGGGSGFAKQDLLKSMARKRYGAAAVDGINYAIRHDTIGFEEFWKEAGGPAALAALKKKKKGSTAKHRALHRKGSKGHRYQADEWIEFFCGGEQSKQAMRLGKKFEDAVQPRFESWLESLEGSDLPKADAIFDYEYEFDPHDVAYRTYASFAGHGIGLWDGELFYETGLVSRDESYGLGKSLEAWMKADRSLSDLAQELDNEISDCSWRAQHGQQ